VNAKSVFYGVLSGVLIFAALTWLEPRQAARAAILATPPAGRFELVQLHSSAASEWSGVLDTETGCVWVYAGQGEPASDATASYKAYEQILGSHFLATINYDASDYVNPAIENGKVSEDYMSPAAMELGKVARLCNESRVRALEGADSRQTLAPCPASDPLGLASSKPCQPLPPKKGKANGN
jgi:hypothetical protein